MHEKTTQGVEPINPYFVDQRALPADNWDQELLSAPALAHEQLMQEMVEELSHTTVFNNPNISPYDLLEAYRRLHNFPDEDHQDTSRPLLEFAESSYNLIKEYKNSHTYKKRKNAVRELLTAPESAILLAGGYPPPETFPNRYTYYALLRAVDKEFSVGRLTGVQRLSQYGSTDGLPELRKHLVQFAQNKGVVVTDPSSVIVTSGSQPGLAGFASAMNQKKLWDGSVLNSGIVGVEGPSYVGALDALDMHGAKYEHIPKDANGIIDLDALEKMLFESSKKNKSEKIRFLYLTPTFQNPTGTTIPRDTREKIAKLLIKYDALLIEDDPYGELRYEGEEVPPIQSFAPNNVIYISTFSKTFVPGMRVGYAVIPPRLEEIKRKYVQANQAFNLFTSNLNQALTFEYIKSEFYQRDLKRKRKTYKVKRDALYKSMTKGGLPEGCKVNKPNGGMFLDIEIPESINSDEFLNELKLVDDQDPNDEAVYIVSETGFYGDLNRAKTNRFRLCFATETPKRLEFAGRKIKRTLQKMTAKAA